MNKQTMKNRIVALYEEDARVASDDALLIARYWEPDWDYNASLEHNLRKLARPASIVRRRRELINEGRIKATDEAEVERYEAFRIEQAEHSDKLRLIDYIEGKEL